MYTRIRYGISYKIYYCVCLKEHGILLLAISNYYIFDIYQGYDELSVFAFRYLLVLFQPSGLIQRRMNCDELRD